MQNEYKAGQWQLLVLDIIAQAPPPRHMEEERDEKPRFL